MTEHLSSLKAVTIAAIFIAPFFWLVTRFPGVFEGGLWHSGSQWSQTHQFLTGAAYPPGIPLFFAAAESLVGPLTATSALFLHAVLFLGGGLVWWRVLGAWIERPLWRWGTFLFSLANPYFLWLVLTSKDTVFEWVAIVSFFWALTSFTRLPEKALGKSVCLLVLLIVLFAFGMLARTALVPIFLALLFAAILFASAYRRQLGAALLCCLGLVGGFLGYQRAVYDYTGLTSTFGYNFYLGQHPLYEYTHPQYDIDVFLAPVVASLVPDPYSVTGDRVLRHLAMEELKKDPIRSLALAVRKTIWHWGNAEKIPNLSANAVLLEEIGDYFVVKSDRIRSVPSLLYSLYKVVYLPLFIIALFFWMQRRTRRDPAILFLVPLIALWPVVVLTFPDTRFKIVGEVVAVAFIAIMWSNREKELRSKE